MYKDSGDYIFYEGNKMGTSVLPLHQYSDTLHDKTNWLWEHEDNKTWYIAYWEIKHDKFYFKHFEGHTKDSDNFGIEFFFPNQSEVFAYWFNDIVRIPGHLVKNAPLAKLKDNDITLYLTFEKGIIIASEFVEERIYVQHRLNWTEEVDDSDLR